MMMDMRAPMIKRDMLISIRENALNFFKGYFILSVAEKKLKEL